jgi:hypothetical protein
VAAVLTTAHLHRQVRELVEDGRAISEIARRLGITTHAARMSWIAAVDGGPEVRFCKSCGAAGIDMAGNPCKACTGTGVA